MDIGGVHLWRGGVTLFKSVMSLMLAACHDCTYQIRMSRDVMAQKPLVPTIGL